MATTVLGGVLDFFKDLGVYDVVLPFILTFTIMFAILERTKVLGEEKEGQTKKNLNAMVAFVVGFLVVASSKLVATITKVSSEIIVLMLLLVFFMMMVGTFFTSKEIREEGVGVKGITRTVFMAIVGIALLLIFLDALETESGNTWLEVVMGWLGQFATNSAVAAIILIVVVIIFIFWITKSE